MRLITFLLTFLLILTACAAPAAPQASPSPSIETMEISAEATFETSLLATEWKGHSEGILLYPLDPARGSACPAMCPFRSAEATFMPFLPTGAPWP